MKKQTGLTTEGQEHPDSELTSQTLDLLCCSFQHTETQNCGYMER